MNLLHWNRSSTYIFLFYLKYRFIYTHIHVNIYIVIMSKIETSYDRFGVIHVFSSHWLKKY